MSFGTPAQLNRAWLALHFQLAVASRTPRGWIQAGRDLPGAAERRPRFSGPADGSAKGSSVFRRVNQPHRAKLGRTLREKSSQGEAALETPPQRQREDATRCCDCRMQRPELQWSHPLEETAEPANGDVGEKKA
jgi:hypothetical protein